METSAQRYAIGTGVAMTKQQRAWRSERERVSRVPTIKELSDSRRTQGLFGNCEMEQAALVILDRYGHRPSAPIDPNVFDTTDEIDGWIDLQRHGWMNGRVPTTAFWDRVHRREEHKP